MSTEVVRYVPPTVATRPAVDTRPTAKATIIVSARTVLTLVATIGALILWAHPLDLVRLRLDAVHITAVIMLWAPILIAATASGPSQTRRPRRPSTFTARMKAQNLGPYRSYRR